MVHPPSPVERRTRDLVADFLSTTTTDFHRRLGDVAGVAVSTQDRRSPRTLSASTTLARDVDRIQFEIGTGPCLSALRSGETLYVEDLAGDDRWGDYGPRAARCGAASCISIPVLVGHPVAVFKVYASTRDGLSRSQREQAVAIAHELTGGFALAIQVTTQAEELDDLTALMTHRRVIDLALGISMERAQVPAAAAFDLLRSTSQQRNVKVHDVAAQIVATIPGAGAQDLIAPYDPAGSPSDNHP